MACGNCGKLNHFAVACNLKKIREIKIEDDEDNFFIDAINGESKSNTLSKSTSWFQKIRINDRIINFKLDTGAEVNVLPLQYLNKLKHVQLKECLSRLEAYDGTQLKTVGVAEIICMSDNEISCQKFVVVETNSVPILGLKGCIELNLVKRIDNISNIDKKEQFIKENIDVFEGLG